MKRYFGLLVSEIFTAVLAVVTLVGVGFGLYANAQRDDMVELAIESMTTLSAQVTESLKAGQRVSCDETFADAAVLTNEFVTLTFGPAPVLKHDPSAGYTASISVETDREKDGEDSFVTARRLLDEIRKKEELKLRVDTKEDDELKYTVLLSDLPACADA